MAPGAWGSGTHRLNSQKAESKQALGLTLKRQDTQPVILSPSEALPSEGSIAFPKAPPARNQMFKHMSPWGAFST